MALVLPTLQQQILNGIKKAQKAKSTEAGNQILAIELAKAIDTYIKSGTVTTVVNTAVVGAGGLYPGPMTGKGTGAGTGNIT